MVTTSKIQIPENQTRVWKFAQTHPAISFLMITFAWSWLFWFGTLLLPETNGLLPMLIVFIGGYGPAIGGILTLGLKNGFVQKWSTKRKTIFVIIFLAIFSLMTIRYLVGNIAGYEPLPADLTINLPIILAAITVCLTGAWVFSAAASTNTDVRKRMGSLVPSKLSLPWTLFSLCFFAILILISWGSAALFGLDIEYPGLWGQSILQVLPLFLLSFALTALARGGNEEPGWRGMLQPALQNKFSPLVASLIVSLFWSLWHLPLYLNGFYSDDLVGGMIGGGVYRILLAIFLTWVYNRSHGKLYLMVILHTTFNMMVNFLPTNDLILVVLWLVVVVTVVMKDKMYRKQPVL